jgi:hypothetical protein
LKYKPQKDISFLLHQLIKSHEIEEIMRTKMPVKIALLLALVACLLAGCFQVDEELWVNPNNSGKLHFEVGISEALLSMSAQSSNSESSFPTDAQTLFNEQGIESKNPNIKNVKTNTISEDGMQKYIIDADIIDISKAFQENSGDTKSGNFTINFEKQPNGHFIFKQTVGSSISTGTSTTDNNSQITQGLLATALADKYWTVKVHLPNMVSTNGQWDKDSKTVTWKIPMTQLVGDKVKPVEMIAEYQPSGLNTWLIIALVGGIFILIGGITIAFLLFRHPKKPQKLPQVSEPEIQQ